MQDEADSLRREAQAVRTTEKSRDGLVAATVDARGELIRLDIDPRIYRQPDSRRLADVITDTVRRAAARSRQRVLEIFDPLIPADQMRAHLEGDLDTVMKQLADQTAGKEHSRGTE
ncbi:YbaB/EbfC family nucleoid-associated protein [Nonomuraea sp. CA-218870]|uniref:YbaB/EbfC family nucleoid-associated protein n=1 Tax=Nonomuraea sp. CA-218870 TaxID=3239998 RepID=UPI003D94F2B8